MKLRNTWPMSVTGIGDAAFARRSRAQPNPKKTNNERRKGSIAAISSHESLSEAIAAKKTAGNALINKMQMPNLAQESLSCPVITVGRLTPEISRSTKWVRLE